jgi:hypothetical protein
MQQRQQQKRGNQVGLLSRLQAQAAGGLLLGRKDTKRKKLKVKRKKNSQLTFSLQMPDSEIKEAAM